MAFNQKQYINDFNKETYQMFPLRIRKDNSIVIQKLKNTRNKNRYVVTLIEKDVSPDVLTIKQIKERTFPVFKKYKINEIYLFGSYARGEANNNSDVDIYCERGDAQSFFDQDNLKEELVQALGKDADLVFVGSQMDEYFEEQLRKDLIKLC